MNRHLSEKDFSEWMMGEHTPEFTEHLIECPQCAAELNRLETPVAMFREAVHMWSADESQRVAAIPSRRGIWSWAIPGSLSGRWLGVAATAAVLMMAVLIGVGESRRAAGLEREDDLLLGQVQAAVDRPVPAPMQPVYELMLGDGAK